MPVITAAKKYLFIVVAKIGDLIPFLHGNAESQSTEIISIEIKDTHGAIKFEVQHLPRVRCAHERKSAVSTASA
jgi:hypothetical protein